MVEHHFMVLPSNSRLLVTSKWCSRRVRVVLVYPNSTRLDGSRYLVQLMCIARPHACTQTVNRIVGDLNSFGFVFESGYCQNRSENLFLEDSHLVMTFQQRWLHVITVLQISLKFVGISAGEYLAAFFLTQVYVTEDFIILYF